ncbi:MAG: hypothetical protein KDB95_14510, partial [Flavobacteriales bacterium]|nr:hypothetical protein [Flavobacteriales bacterium]
MELALANYRLLFIHPFGTAHGVRDGTDSVFVRLSHAGEVGYGEATLPPYLDFSQATVHEELVVFWLKHGDRITERSIPATDLDTLSPPARAAFIAAYRSLLYNLIGVQYESELPHHLGPHRRASAMVTLGHSDVDGILMKINELPDSPVLKVKVGARNDVEVLQELMRVDQRPLFLDANQGWVDPVEAEAVIAMVGPERLVGIEQPFPKDRWDLHKALKDRTNVTIYGDESIQAFEDIERAPEAFGGVNLKLMKCGGLDSAERMAARARALGLRVMLGSMSESSLGCATMFALSGSADLLDLDGPWLIWNDPFQGLELDRAGMRVTGSTGFGV